MDRETLIILGTGNATVTKCFNTCFAIQTGEEYFLVDSGGGNGTVYLDSNHNGEWDFISDEMLTLAGYSACGATHEAPTTDDFEEGFFITGVFPPYNVQKVIVWRGENGDNVHCTTNLDMTSWPTAKS